MVLLVCCCGAAVCEGDGCLSAVAAAVCGCYTRDDAPVRLTSIRASGFEMARVLLHIVVVEGKVLSLLSVYNPMGPRSNDIRHPFALYYVSAYRVLFRTKKTHTNEAQESHRTLRHPPSQPTQSNDHHNYLSRFIHLLVSRRIKRSYHAHIQHLPLHLQNC